MNELACARLPWVRWLWLLAASAVAGALSGLLMLWDGLIRGAVFGIALSMGHVFIGLRARRDLDERKPPAWGVVLTAAALAAGLAWGVVISLQRTGILTGESRPGPFSLLGICLLYAFGFHAAWRLRWGKTARASWSALGLFFLTAMVGGAVRVLAASGTADGEALVMSPAFVLIGAAFTGLPFTLLWGVASVELDPARSSRRWRRARGLEPS